MSRRHGAGRMAKRGDCPTGKVAFTNFKTAAKVKRKIEGERVYRGTCCGFYHVTSETEGEYAQRVARFRGVDPSSRGVQLDEPMVG